MKHLFLLLFLSVIVVAAACITRANWTTKEVISIQVQGDQCVYEAKDGSVLIGKYPVAPGTKVTGFWW